MSAIKNPASRDFRLPEVIFAASDRPSSELEAEFGRRLKQIEDGSAELASFDENTRKVIVRIALMIASNRTDFASEKRPSKVSMYGALKGKVGMTSDFDAPIDDFAEYI